MPLVSICLPTYNGEIYLVECLESILEQTLSDFELVVVDDASTDSTVSIIQKYVNRDSRVSLHSNRKRLGLVGNFNRTLSMATGRYVCIWGQDDVMLRQNLEVKVKFLETHSTIGFVHSNIYQIDAHGNVTGEHFRPGSTTDWVSSGIEFFKKMVFEKNLVCCPSVLARKECYDRVDGFIEGLYYTCDLEMWMKMSLFYDVACIGTPLIKYRRHHAAETTRIANTPAEIEQVFLAKDSVFERYSCRIPEAKRLRNEMKKQLAKRALSSAIASFYERELRESRKCLLMAVKMNPWLFKEPACLKLVVKLNVGDRGSSAYRALRSMFRS